MDDRSVDNSNPGDTIVVCIVVDEDVGIVVIFLFKLLLLVEEDVGANIPYS